MTHSWEPLQEPSLTIHIDTGLVYGFVWIVGMGSINPKSVFTVRSKDIVDREVKVWPSAMRRTVSRCLLHVLEQNEMGDWSELGWASAGLSLLWKAPMNGDTIGISQSVILLLADRPPYLIVHAFRLKNKDSLYL